MIEQTDFSPADIFYFQVIAEQLNISQAAERLNISQPSLSMAIRRLETAIGAAILNRHKRGVTLTPAGQSLLASSKQLLAQWEQVKRSASDANQTVQGEVSIGCNSAIALYALPKCLPSLLKDNPKLQLNFRHDRSRVIVDLVNNLSLDIGIVINPLPHPNLVIQLLGKDQVQCWLAAKTNWQRLQQTGLTLIADLQLAQTQALLKLLRKRKISPQRIINTGNLQLVAELTQAGVGVGILPERVAQLYSGLKLMPQTPHVHDELYLIYRQENRAIKAINVVCAAIKQAFKS